MPVIDRDTYGIPHIYGAAEADAAFGFGYAQAQDHLTLMLRNYMEAAGRLAEIDGESAIDTQDTRIRVRTNGGLVEERRTLSWTRHGPVFGILDNNAFTIRMSGYDIVDPITPFLRIARARRLADFKAALATLDIPMFNFVYGDASGAIYYVYNERCPVRSEAYDWRAPVPGWTSDTAWDGHLPFEALPQIENPVSGFLQNCNNAPWYVTPDSRIRADDYPSYAVFEETNGRCRRMLAYLQAHNRITVEQALEMVMDEYNVTAEELKPQLIRAWTDRQGTLDDPDERLADAINLLDAWDNTGDVESAGMSLFALWKTHYDALLDMQSDEIKKEKQVILMLDALRRTVNYMRDRYGRLDVRWGDIHVLRRGDREFPVGGSSYGTESIRPVRGALNHDGKMIADYGSAFTMVVELGASVRAWSLVPYGNSERPDSPHYDDQAPLWTDKKLKRTCFTKEEVAANLESREEIKRMDE